MNPVIWEDMQEIEKRSNSWLWLKNKTVLITGAYGMLASYLVFFLIYLNEVHPEQNTTIVMLGRNSKKASDRFGDYMSRPYVYFAEADLCKPLGLGVRIDYIIHAASLASPQYYGVNPVGVMLPNVMGTYQLLELAREQQCEGFLFFSSGDVYGKIAQTEPVVHESDWGCLDSMDLRSCYGESKRMAEWCSCEVRSYLPYLWSDPGFAERSADVC